MAISETMKRNDKSSEITAPKGFTTWRVEREGHAKGGGGLCIMYKESLDPHCWNPSVPEDLKYVSKERQWLLFDGPQGRLAFLHVYMACQSSNDDGYLKWNDDLFQLLIDETNILRNQNFAVLALGDFNSKVGRIPGMELNLSQLNNNTPKFLNFVHSTNMVIINTLPISKGLFTHFMNDRSSVLDYGLIDEEHVSHISSFVIDSKARYSCGSDHALLEASIQFGPKINVPWKYTDVLQYNFKSNSDFSAFKRHLDCNVDSLPLSEFSALSTKDMLHHMTEWLNAAGKDCFGIKVPLKRRGRRLPPDILKLIQHRTQVEQLYHEAVEVSDHATADNLLSSLQDIKVDLKNKISKMKLKQRNFKRNQILKNDPSKKKFWSFLRSKFKKTGTLSGVLNKNGNMVFNQSEIESTVVDHFANIFHGQKEPPSSSNNNSSNSASITPEEVDAVCGGQRHTRQPAEFEEDVCSPMTYTELEGLLDMLPKGKSSGYDYIPNEFLINSSDKFKQYLLIFYNKILEEGKVPEELNIGKCVLIHKVNHCINPLVTKVSQPPDYDC